MKQLPPAFWSISGTEILQHLETAKEGLSGDEARQRLARYGSNLLKPQKRSERTSSLWMGTHVVSGSAKALVISTGKETEFGKVSERLKLRPQETDFEHGVRRFGYFLLYLPTSPEALKKWGEDIQHSSPPLARASASVTVSSG